MIKKIFLLFLLVLTTAYVADSGYTQLRSYYPPHSEKTCFETVLPSNYGEGPLDPSESDQVRVFIAVHKNNISKKTSVVTVRYIFEETNQYIDEEFVVSFEDLRLSAVIGRDCKYE